MKKACLYILAVCWCVCSSTIAQAQSRTDEMLKQSAALKKSALAVMAAEVSDDYGPLYSFLNKFTKRAWTQEQFLKAMSALHKRGNGEWIPRSVWVVEGKPTLGYIILEKKGVKPDEGPVVMIFILEDGEWKILSFPGGRLEMFLSETLRKMLRGEMKSS